jgi:hypothetical protein
MRLSRTWGAPMALVVTLWSGMAVAATDDKAPVANTGGPNAVDIIFNHKHLANVEAGQELVYKFNRSVSDPTLLGQSFQDDVTLKVTDTKPSGQKDVDLQIYTGDRARDLQKLPDIDVNPVFQVYFAQGTNTYSMLSGGKTPYLTRAFSLAFKDKAKVEPVKVDYKGKKVDAYRIDMAPYHDDQNAPKMQGWEDARYVMVVSDQVPGQIVELSADYKNNYPGGLHMMEHYTLDGATPLEDDVKAVAKGDAK